MLVKRKLVACGDRSTHGEYLCTENVSAFSVTKNIAYFVSLISE
jgi:hypothetical protein